MSQKHLQSDIQTALKEIFASLIVGISAEELDVHANIFDLGLESIAFMEIRGAIKEKLGVNISLRSMLENNSTIHELSGYIAAKMPEATGVSRALPKRESLEKPETPSKNGAAVRGPLGKQVSGSLTSQTAVERIVSQQLHLASQQVQMMSKQLELLRKGSSGQPQTQAPRPSQPSTNKEKILELGTGRPERIKPSPKTEKSEVVGLTAQQQQHLDALIARVVHRTQESKRLTQAARKVLANPRAIIGFDRSIKEMLYPLHIQRGAGARIWDVDGNEYIDLAMGFGPLLFGHSPSFVIEAIQEHVQLGLQNGPQSHLTGKVAELMCELTGQERVCFCNSGTEAVMGAIRIARATTGRTKIARFAGSYHGHSDEVLVAQIGNGDGKSLTIPAFPGIPEHKTEQVIMLDYGNPESLDIVKAHAHELAAVLVEPVQSRRPDLQPREFLHQLRELTLSTGIALIVDEVLTGFRMHPGGIQGLWGIQADISTYGKAMGAGLPIGVVAGKASFMDALDGGFWSYGDKSYPPTDVTFFAGTFFKNPLVMTVVWAVLNHIKDRGPQLQAELTEKTTSLANNLNDYFRASQLPIQVVHCGSLFRFSYRSQPWMNLLYYHLLERGIYVSEGRNLFLSTAHTDEDIEQIIRAVKASIEDMQAGGFLPRYPSTVSDQSDEEKKEVELPLTAFQKELWITAQMAEGASEAYNESIGIHLRGRLNLEVMGKVVRELVNRHEALRTTFSPQGDYQRIALIGSLDIPLVDFSTLDNDTRDAEVSQLLALEAGKTFDFEVGPLFRPLVVKLSEEHHLLLLTYHHLVVDGWSLKILLRELGVIYSAQCQGVSYDLPQPMQYSEYVRRLETRGPSREMAEAETYWLQQFASSIPILDMPTDRWRPSVNRYRGDRQTLKLGEDLCDRLKSLSGECKCTLFTTLLAGFMVLLHRLSGQNDIVVGIPTAGQLSAGCEDLVGHCANLLPLRMKVDWDPTFKDYTSAVKKVLLNGYDHQIYPLLDLIQKLQLPRDRSRTSLIGTLFNLDNIDRTLEFRGLEVELAPNHGRGAKFDLVFDIAQTNSDLIVMCDYNSDLFDAQTIRRWLGHFQTLLSGAAANSETPISQLPLLTEAERRQMLVEWNDTDADYPQDKCIHQLFEQQVERTPEAVALVFGEEKLTYQQLNERANQLAHYLQSMGVGPETLVGICLERSVEMVVGLLGILKAGGAYVPIDPAYPAERIAYMLGLAKVPVLLLLARQATSLPNHQAQAIYLDLDEETISQQQRSNPASAVLLDNLAYVIYTSGSTGKPKGVMNTHKGVCNRLLWMQEAYQLTASDRVVQKTPFSFDVSVWEFFWTLSTGACLLVAKPDGHKDPRYLVELIQKSQITTLHFVPSMLQVFLEAPEVTKCVSLKRVICSGESLTADLVERFFSLLDCELHNLYGPTEAAIDVTAWACQPGESSPIVPIGRPIANSKLYILSEWGQPVPVGVTGSLYIGGIQVARGYLNRPELTAEKFIGDPFGTGRLYNTGDLARYRGDGNIEFVGRIDQQVKIRGFRIELGEIEASLSGYPQVRSAVVLAREDQPGDKRLVAYIVGHQTAPDAAELRQFLKGKLPEYMVPAAFVMLETIPVTPNGKVDRRALPAPDLQMIPSSDFIAPQTPTQHAIADIFASVLGIETVGINNNFFELGGHSLLATKVISRLRKTFQIELPIRSIFEAPTVAELDPLIHQVLTGDIGQMAPPLVVVPRTAENKLPLSMAQERLWFLNKLENDASTTYNMPFAIKFEGKLDVQALEHAVSELVKRHDVLRTSIMTIDGRPVQEIAPAVRIPLQHVNLQNHAPQEREHLVEQYMASEEQTPFNLSEAPLLRTTVLQTTPDDFVFLVTIHHIISDGWSIGVMISELTKFYIAYVEDREPSVTPLPIQYADYALWQRQWLQGEILEQQLTYWTKQLVGAPTLLELPTDRPRPAIQTYKGRTELFALDAGLTKQLKQLAQQEGTTLFMLLLAAFGTLLYRYSGQEDIVIGSAIANRTREEIEPLIGFFVNTLALRLRLGSIKTFAQLLHQVRQTTLDAYIHQDLPFAQLVEALRVERSLSYSPLFQVMFVLQNAPVGEMEIPGLTIAPIEFSTTTAKFDLTLSMEETQTGLLGSWEYNVDLFEAATIGRMAKHFQVLLEGVVTNPQGQVSQLPLLSSAERRQLLEEWNDTDADYPQDKCIHQLFEQQVERTPEAVALVFGSEKLTYQQLNERANQLAHYLQSVGVGPEKLVGLCLERSFEMVVGLLGILKAGGAYLPLDISYPRERLAFTIADAGIQVLVTHSTLQSELPAGTAPVVCIDTNQNVLAAPSSSPPASTVQPDHLAYIIYTSGSTGQPKGVAMTHRPLVNLLQWQQHQSWVELEEKTLQFSPIGFDVSFQEIFATCCFGGTLVLLAEEVRLDPDTLLDYLREQAITRLFLPFVALQQLAEAARRRSALPLKAVFTAGEQLQVGEAIASFFEQLPDCTLYNHYGPTESHVVTAFTLTGPVEQWQYLPPIGKPIANARVYVLDRALHPVPIGVPGELYLGGSCLARGYLHRRDLTAAKFICDPFSHDPSARLYKTGDLVRYRPDGNLEYLGRLDNQVKVRGFRIELREIEVVLSQHVQVHQTVVTVRQSEAGNKYLVAYVVPVLPPDPLAPNQRLTPGELRQFLSSRLPEYAIPGTFVLLDILPLTPSGKVDRRALPAPELEMITGSDFMAPRTPTQQALADIFAEVLGIEAVGVDNNFFELGGHSLLATQVISRLRETFQIELPVRSIFEAPTVAELDELMNQALMGDRSQMAPPLVAVPRDAESLLPLGLAQERLWFLSKLEDDASATYNMSGAMRIEGQLDVEALEQALNALVERHEVLRTSIITVDGRPVQKIAPLLRMTLQQVNLQTLAPNERELRVQQFIRSEEQTPFNLSEAPLLRATVLIIAPSKFVFLVTKHHIISDGWSIGVMMGELTQLYQAYVEGRQHALTPLPLQYADYALWQRQWLQGEILEQQLSYWTKQLAGTPTLLEMPTDRPRPAVQTYKGRTDLFTLDVGLTKQLKQLAQQQGTTLFMLLLAAFGTLLYRYSGQSDIVIGSPIANRTRAEIEPLIGFFANTLALRLRLGSILTFAELLHQVRQTTLDAYIHQDLPFAQLVEALQVERSLSYSPVFQVMFVLQNAPVGELELPGVTIAEIDLEGTTAKFDITLSMEETQTGLLGSWEYNVDLFEATTIGRMAKHFQLLLEGVVANPQAPVFQLPLLTEAESRQMLVEWNDTDADYPQNICIHQLFEQQVERTPKGVALVFGEEKLTYQQLNERANQLAHYLQSVGVGPEKLVGLCLERSFEMVVGLLGILKAGGAYLPLDISYPRERLAFTIADAGIQVLVTHSTVQSELPAGTAPVVCIDTNQNVLATPSSYPPASKVQPDHLAYVIYTSGSTGQPKGVAMTHRPLVNLLQWQQHQSWVELEERTLQFSPIGFDVSFQEIFATLCFGGTLVLVTEEVRLDPDTLLDYLREQAITRLFLPFVALQQLAEAARRRSALPLKAVFTAGEQLQVGEAIASFFEQLPDCTLYNHYGPTESHVVTAFTLTGPVEKWQYLPPIGKPIANARIYVLDRALHPVPIGVPGEIHIGGASLARGYLNRPELTLSKFIPNPFSNSPGARLYKTGDLARYRSDGNIEFVGRIDNQVKIRGFRIELGEIEATLRGHIKVRSTVVVTREDQPGDKRLVAYIVSEQTAPDAAELREFLKGKLPNYMVPTAFVMLETLPLTPNGKIDRRALPAPDINASGSEACFIPPRNTTELQLSQIWSRLLNIPAVGVRDNFFDLGGHSLLAVRLMASIKQQFGTHLPLATLFTKGTIEHQASLLSAAPNTLPSSPLVAIQPMGSLPPFFCVHPVGGNVLCYVELARQLGVEFPFYGLQAVGVNGEEECLTRISDMATTYIKAMQTVQPQGPYKLGGWSFGGSVAFEMAQQLQSLGHEITLLALIDSYPSAMIDNPYPDEAMLVTDFAINLSRSFDKELAVSVNELRQLSLDEQLNYILDEAKILQILPEIGLEQMRQLFAVFQANLQALHSYVPQPYSGQITLFNAEETSAQLAEQQIKAMSSPATGDINIHKIAGDHYSIIRSEALAKAIGMYLKGERNPIDH